MIPALLKLILYALLAYIIYQLIRFFRAVKRLKKSSSSSKSGSGMMVKDEICNTYIPEEDAVKEIHQGKEYYFCSQECRKKFLEQKKSV
ncbi:MAG: YHS domain-containing protein [Candidatus Aminicenantes bacterium]